MPILKNAAYPFPEVTPRFLGTIIQNYRPRGGVPASGFQKWVEDINEIVEKLLIPELDTLDMMLPNEVYEDLELGYGRCLATIPDFNTLIAKSQAAQTPVFALTSQQIGQTGVVLERTLKSRDNFLEIFTKLADNIVTLTAYDVSN